MKWTDLLSISWANLRKRKLRSALTIIGVVIGITAIVVMMSLGIGLADAGMRSMSSSKGLVTINVNPSWDQDKDEEAIKLTDEAAAEISEIPGVKYVSPVLSVYLTMRSGEYVLDTVIKGVSYQALQDLDMEFAEGGLPEPGDPLALIYGSEVKQMLVPVSAYEGGNWDFEEPDIDFMKATMFATFPPPAGADPEKEPPGKKYILPAAGVQKSDPNSYNEYSWDIYADIEALKTQMHRVYKGKAWPDQEATKSGKPKGPFTYSQLIVRTDSVEHTKEVQQVLRDAGYNTNSEIEYIDAMRQQSRITQAILGGIGGISLLVAAIGIANTMMMSIYERTKEIGIMKVLGCSLSNIRAMFLIEAALIGAIGGVLGLLQSYALSFLINKIAGGLMTGAESIRISLIPPWLSLAAVLFAMIVGIASGMMPAMRAMKLSPLEAIRNQ